MKSFKLLTEQICLEAKVETVLDEATKEKKMYLSGIGLQANLLNKNNRIYPKEILFEAVDKHINEMMSLGRCVGELEHPKVNSHDINLDRISHKFTDVQKDGDNIYLKALVLNTTCGQQLKNIIEGDIVVGFSSRCLGGTKQSNNTNVVQPGLKIVSLSDCVFNQSAYDAFANAIYEHKTEWIYENGVLVEKDLTKNIENYRDLINKTTKQERSKIFAEIFIDYLKKIKV